MKLWKRNAVVAAIVLFVCAAVYLNWSYDREDTAETADTGKVLGEAALVGAKADDPLLSGPAAEPDTDEPPEPETPQSTSSGYFANARLNRQQARDSALSLLMQAAEDEKAEQSAIAQANQSLQAIANYTICEANIENLVTAKGYVDCVAFLSENSISVVVSKGGDGLDPVDAARISEIVMEETGLPASQITIIETA